MESDKEIRADATLKNLVERDPQAAEDLWRFRYPEEGGTKITFDEILVEIPLRYGFTVALSTLSEFYSWFRRRRRIEAARATAEQGKRDMALADPQASLEAVEAYGQFIFTSECLEEGDKLNFVRLKKIRQSEKALELEAKRIDLLEKKLAAAEDAKAKITAATTKAKGAGGLTLETIREIEEAAKLL